MSDRFTTVTSESWFSRIGGALKGILVGIVLFIVAFPVLFWNEGRAVRNYKTLQEGQRTVVSVPVDQVDSANEGKLIHVTGIATTPEVLTDPVFGVSANALKLKRTVEYYQWKETEHSTTEKKLGGNTETVTTYEYQQVWSPDPIDSSAFKKPTGHENTAPTTFPDLTVSAQNVTLGAFRLTSSLLSQINNFTTLPVALEANSPLALKDKVRETGTGFYAGLEPTAPKIGDARITFMSVTPMGVSVIARQIRDSFEPYTASTGKYVELLATGAHSAAEMFMTAQTQNKILTWILRAVGLFLMLFALVSILRPLSVLADVLPFLGNIVSGGTFFISFILAGALTLVTVAIAWIVYRPLLGVALLAVAGGLAVLIRQKLKSRAAPQPVSGP